MPFRPFPFKVSAGARRVRTAVLALILTTGALAPGLPQAEAVAVDVPDETWVTNGDVRSVVQAGGRIYLGGSFDQVGPNTGSGVLLDPTTGQRAAAFPKVNGVVHVVVPDGAGGWYIGGDFTRVGDKSRQNAANILADGRVGGWNPNTDFAVRAIILSKAPGANLAWIGGDFTVVNKTISPIPAAGLAATNLFTGSMVWGLPGATTDAVQALAISNDGTRLFVGGAFTSLGGVASARLAAVDPATGAVDVSFSPAPDGPVAALASRSDGRLYAGGAFAHIGGTARANLGAVTLPSGAADATWQPATDGPVNALALTADSNRLYIGGDFTNVGGQARARLAALSTAGGGAVDDTWAPGAPVVVRAIALSSDGSRVYAGGGDDNDDPSLIGPPRRFLRAFHPATGAVDGTFDPRPAASVEAIAAAGGGLYAGGQFTSVNGVARANLAALDAASGALDTGFVADTDEPVNAVVSDGVAVHAGGVFNKVNGATRRRLVKVAAATGAVEPWQANVSASVETLVLAGPRLYVGGAFSAIGGVTRNNLASVSATTGTLDSWDPNIDSAVHRIRMAPDQTKVYIAGDFTRVGPSARQKLAAVGVASGLATSWYPKPTVPLVSLAVSADGSLVYVATRGSKTAGNRIQAYHSATGALAWQQLGDGDFQAVDVNADLVYAGGHFTTIGGNVRGHLAAFNQRTGDLQPWAPPISGVHGVLDIHVTVGAVLVAGEFHKVAGTVAQGVARFTAPGEGPPVTTTTTTTTAPPTTSTTAPTTTTAPPTTTTTAPPGPEVGAAAATGRAGYWMVGSDGTVYAFGDAAHHGNAHPPAGARAIDLEPTPTGRGYWVVDDRGLVSAFGDAQFLGHADRSKLVPGETVTSLSSTPTGRGYWMFTTRGRVLSAGDATGYGDMSATRLNGPVLDSIPTPSGRGYYMVASDGGIFAFGDARFYGSMGSTRLNAPVQSLVPDADGAGYWLVASDGGIFAFAAPFKGSMGSIRLNKPVTGMVRFGDGYLMVGEDGGIFNFSTRPFFGSLGDRPPANPIVSVAAYEG